MYAETKNLETLLMWLRDAVNTIDHCVHDTLMSVIVWYNPCVITQYCDLARNMSSRDSVVERSTSVRKVMGSIPIWSSDFFWVLCLRFFCISYSEEKVLNSEDPLSA